MDEVRIIKVEKGTSEADRLLEFVKHCSWVEARDHIAGLIENWEFTDWETMFAAVIGGRIVGMCSLLKTDYYPLDDIFPWVSCVFVDEKYRGHRLSEKLIGFANDCARGLGFSRTYIPTEFTGLYEKYGYTFVKNITNYGGGVDRLLVKYIS